MSSHVVNLNDRSIELILLSQLSQQRSKWLQTKISELYIAKAMKIDGKSREGGFALTK